MAERRIRTTISIPAGLIERVDREVNAGLADSRNDLFADALRREIRRRDRERIDAEIALMAGDDWYRRESAVLDLEFATADEEAWASLPPEDDESSSRVVDEAS